MAYRIGQIISTSSRKNYDVDENGNYIIVNGDGAPPYDVMNEIKTTFGVQKLSHIGIQAPPGSLFALDDEVIMIGRSGSYELFNDLVTISSIKILSPATYIIDFRY